VSTLVLFEFIRKGTRNVEEEALIEIEEDLITSIR